MKETSPFPPRIDEMHDKDVNDGGYVSPSTWLLAAIAQAVYGDPELIKDQIDKMVA